MRGGVWRHARHRITGHGGIRVPGHDVRLIPPTYVKPYVMRQKNDAGDAAAICEAVFRAHMRTVAIKSEEQQGVSCTARVTC